MSSKNRIFGTDGVRAIAGTGPLALDRVFAIGLALSDLLGGEDSRAAVCRDTRRSGPAILDSLAGGIAAGGVEVVNAGVHSTPAIAWYSKAWGCSFSAVISASHNPAEYNGIKVFGPGGGKLALESEIALEAMLSSASGLRSPLKAARIVEPPPGPDPYLSFLFDRGKDAAGLAGLKIVLDAANGAAFSDGPAILRELGADVRAVNVTPDGDNINMSCGALHPEGMAGTVLESGSFAGVALDGDADRAIFSCEQGIIRDGDFALAALALHLDALGRLPGKRIVGTVMTNAGLEHFLAGRGISLHRTDVGDRNVAVAMNETGAALGGEPSGHVIFAEDGELLPGDGMLTAIRLFGAAARAGVPLSGLAPGFALFPQVIANVDVNSKPDFSDIPGLETALDDARLAVGNGGRIVLRYSGTEPKARVMVEGPDGAEVAKHASLIARVIRFAAGRQL